MALVQNERPRDDQMARASRMDVESFKLDWKASMGKAAPRPVVLGAEAWASGLDREQCPYWDNRKDDGKLTWSRSFRNEWRRGWDGMAAHRRPSYGEDGETGMESSAGRSTPGEWYTDGTFVLAGGGLAMDVHSRKYGHVLRVYGNGAPRAQEVLLPSNPDFAPKAVTLLANARLAALSPELAQMAERVVALDVCGRFCERPGDPCDDDAEDGDAVCRSCDECPIQGLVGLLGSLERPL